MWMARLRPRGTGRPRVAMLADVRGWAWDYKARQVRRWLADEFDVDVLYRKEYRDERLGIVAAMGYDLVFTFDCDLVPLLSEVDPRRLITGVTSHDFERHPDHPRWLARASCVHAVCETLLAAVRAHHPRCFHLPNGVDERLFSPQPRDLAAPFTVGFVGRPIATKGFDRYVVPACERAGVELASLTATYRSAQRRSHAEMPEFYRGVDAVIVASQMDGMPNHLLEAAACARTFVANPIGIVPEFHEAGNGFVVPLEVEAYVEKLVFLKERRELCAAMGTRARGTVERHWTWRQRAEGYRRLFRAALAQAAVGSEAPASADDQRQREAAG